MAPPAAFGPGRTVDITVELRIAPGYHLNSDQPAEENLVPTGIVFKPVQGADFGPAIFPVAEMKMFSFADKPLAVFQGTLKAKIPVTLAKDFKGKEIIIEGSVGYQACDDISCLAPDEAKFRAVFPVSTGASVAGPQRESLPQAPPVREAEVNRRPEASPGAAPLPKPGGQEDLAKTVRERGWPLTFLLVFLAGLALNLTPCVYPLIPITISYFGGQAGGKKGSLMVHALLYVLGMAVTYSLLGSAAAFTGGLFGAALQVPAVLLAVAAIMVALSLSMFDLYEFRLPGFLNRMAGTSRKGFFGTLFMGLTVGMVAAPCIGPFVFGLLTYVGDRGNVLLGFWMFLLLALGLGLPFLVLAIFSGSINRLPRSGAWMVWVRKIFGFVLLAMALYFLRPLFPDTLLYSLTMALLLLVAGIYLAWVEPTRTEGKLFPLLRNLVGIGFFIIALLFARGGIKDFMDHRILELASQPHPGSIQWLAYSEARLLEAAREGWPVFIDFYADWCIPCQELDKKIFSDPEVASLSRRFLMVKADLTFSLNPQTRKLRKQFGIPGVPTLVFMAANGRELANLRVAGYIDKKEFLSRMKQALAD